jgi:hypothetical protein
VENGSANDTQRQEYIVTKRANGELTKRERIIYRTATGIVYAVMVFTIINFVFNDRFPFPDGPEGAFVHLGINPTTAAINKGGFGAVNGVRPVRILQAVVRFAF